MVRLALLTASLALLPCAVADAGTARGSAPPPCEQYACNTPRAVFQAAPGEVNDLTASPDGVLRDAGAPLTAGELCTQIDAHAVRCDGGGFLAYLADGDDRAQGAMAAHGGPGNDVLTVTGSTAYGDEGDDVLEVTGGAHGGPGDDRLSAASGESVSLNGDEGNDELSGADRDDSLDGGPGRDVVVGHGGMDIVADSDAEPGADRLDGGEGSDMLNLGRAGTAAVTVDLATQSTSDRDAVAGFENAIGSGGNDVLVGDAGPNLLNGGPGEDRLVGAAGDDQLEGSSGFDHFDGGDGGDVIEAAGTGWAFRGLAGHQRGLDAEPEPIVCGAGTDVIKGIRGDHVARDCEGIGETRLPPFPRNLGRRGVGFAMRCPLPMTGKQRGCRGVVRIETSYGSTVARVRFSVPARGGRVVLRAAVEPQFLYQITIRFAGLPPLRWLIGEGDA